MNGIQLLDAYEKDRKTYPNMAAFLPRYRQFLQAWTKQMALYPNVTAIDELNGDKTAISPQIRQLTIHFSKPMDASKGMSIYCGNAGMAHFPPLDVPACRYTADGKTFIMPFKKGATLNPNWDYTFIMKGKRFQSRDEYPLRQKVVFFKTAAT